MDRDVVEMIEEKKENIQDLGRLEDEKINFVSLEEEELITIARDILLNTAFSLSDRIDLLMTAIPKKELILKAIQQIYESNEFDRDDFLSLHAMYCFALL